MSGRFVGRFALGLAHMVAIFYGGALALFVSQADVSPGEQSAARICGGLMVLMGIVGVAILLDASTRRRLWIALGLLAGELLAFAILVRAWS